MPVVHAWSLFVPGEPFGMPRPRFNVRSGGTYPEDAQEAFAEKVGDAWAALGGPRLPADLPYDLYVWARMKRPAAHFRKDGTLTPKGEREPHPLRKPDGDNLLKQVDVLVKLGAVPDDARAVSMSVKKEWAREGYPVGMTFVVRSLPIPTIPEEMLT